jgi:hypothetical protein
VSQICPCCGGTGLAPGASIAPDPVDELRRRALEQGFYVSPADEVRTDAAASLLGMKPGTLRQYRCYFDRIPHRRVGGRVVYRLADLAKRLFPSMRDEGESAEDVAIVHAPAAED